MSTSLSPLLAPLFSSPAMRAVCDDATTLQHMLDFEAALAQAEAQIGVIPAGATAPIAEACKAGALDIAALAEAAGLLVSPHGPASPVGNVAAAHVSATLPNFDILEFSFGEVPWRAELIDPPEQLSGGNLPLSARPGFGIDINEKTARKYAVA